MTSCRRNSGPASLPEPLRIAFLGCGFITDVHSRNLRSLRNEVRAATPAVMPRSRSVLQALRRERKLRRLRRGDRRSAGRCGGRRRAAQFHLDLTLQALAAGKHVLVEKPAFLRIEDYETVIAARDRRGASCSSARTITISRWRSVFAGW